MLRFIANQDHEFDGREITTAWPALRERCAALGITMLECESLVLRDAFGRRIRFVATVRWCDFDLFGRSGRDRAIRAAAYYMRVMRATRNGHPFDATAARSESLRCREWLHLELRQPVNAWDRTVAITHFGPSLRSADPRYGEQPGTASFCNADDDLIPLADLWIHGHLHTRHDYRVVHAKGATRVVCNARGHSTRGESEGYRGDLVVEV